MGNWIREKYKHYLYNPHTARKKSLDKYAKAFEWYTDLLQKEKNLWSTRWLTKTKVKAEARLKKYWITNQMVLNYLQKKWKADLLS